MNSRIDKLQAAFLRVKPGRLEQWNARRDEIARQYLNAREGTANLALPVVLPNTDPARHLFMVRHLDRSGLQNHLTVAGIGTLIYYPVPPRGSGACQKIAPGENDAFPISDAMAETVVSLPVSPHYTSDEVSAVCQSIRECST